MSKTRFFIKAETTQGTEEYLGRYTLNGPLEVMATFEMASAFVTRGEAQAALDLEERRGTRLPGITTAWVTERTI